MKQEKTKQGILLYNEKEAGSGIIMEDIKRKPLFSEEYLNNEGIMRGFEAYHDQTKEPYHLSTVISSKIGDPGLHIILENQKEPVDYGKTLDEALVKAHNHLIESIFEDPYLKCPKILDRTETGLYLFNKGNLSELGKTNTLQDQIEEENFRRPGCSFL